MSFFGKYGRMMFRSVKDSPFSLVAGMGCAIGATMIPQTLGLPRYRRIIAHYKDDIELPIDNNTSELIDKVLNRIDMSPNNEARIKFFTSVPQDPLHKGCVEVHTGALIGFPSTFAYRTTEDIERDSIVLNQQPVDWSSDAGEELQQALVLSDKAKAFAIAREIFYVKAFSFHTDLVLKFASVWAAYSAGATFSRWFMLPLRLNAASRLCVYSVFAAFGSLLYLACNDIYHWRLDNRADKAAAVLRKIYAEGGVEYYDAVLRRNCALRLLLGSSGEKQYTYYGNVVSTWRNPSVQLTSRRDNLQKYLAEYEPVNQIQPHIEFDHE